MLLLSGWLHHHYISMCRTIVASCSFVCLLYGDCISLYRTNIIPGQVPDLTGQEDVPRPLRPSSAFHLRNRLLSRMGTQVSDTTSCWVGSLSCSHHQLSLCAHTHTHTHTHTDSWSSCSSKSPHYKHGSHWSAEVEIDHHRANMQYNSLTLIAIGVNWCMIWVL